MVIKINENWTIESDTLQWILKFEKEGEVNPKTGRPTLTKDSFYYNKLSEAIRAYINKMLQSQEGTFTPDDVLEKFIKEEEKLVQLMSKYDKLEK